MMQQIEALQQFREINKQKAEEKYFTNKNLNTESNT